MRHRCVFRLGACAVVFGAWAAVSRGAEAGVLRVGAARVDITPAAGAALPMSGYASRVEGFKGIHDNIYVRAIVLDDGNTQAALVTWELLFVTNTAWLDTSRRIAAESGIRPENLLLAAVHNHGAPALMGGSAAPGSGTAAFTRHVEDAAVEAVRLAKSRLQPARFGIGTGAAYVNVNRREPSADRGWVLGYNENGPSDKTVTVLRFDDLSGKPIAFFINYPVHAVVMGPRNYQITGDLAGATSRFVEQHYMGNDDPRSDEGPRVRIPPPETRNADGVVAIWTSGAAGDQNPVSMANGPDFTLVESLGKILGQAVLRASVGIEMAPQLKLSGAQQVITCAGRRVDPQSNARTGYRFSDSDPVEVRLTLLMIDRVALAGVSGEVFTEIHQHLMKKSPFARTVMVTHANGSSGYIPSDTAFDQISYEITASRLSPGCAENAIVNGFLEMMRR